MSDKSVRKATKIDKSKINNQDYFTSFVLQAQQSGETDEIFTQKIKLSCMELLAQQCENYTGGQSSSVREETAQSIMQSMFFTLDLYAKSIDDTEQLLCNIKELPIRVMYAKGRQITEKKLRLAKMLYTQACKNAIITDNICYNDTLLKGGIYGFFKKYNADYDAKDIPGAIDYPLAHAVTDCYGVEYIISYLDILYMENQFCSFFDSYKTERLLNGYGQNASELVINIYEALFTQCIGCILANKNPLELELTQEDVLLLAEKLKSISKDDRISSVLLAYKALTKGMGIKNKKMLAYTQKTAKRVLQRLFYNLKTNTLDKLFIVPQDTQFELGFEEQESDFDELYELDELDL